MSLKVSKIATLEADCKGMLSNLWWMWSCYLDDFTELGAKTPAKSGVSTNISEDGRRAKPNGRWANTTLVADARFRRVKWSSEKTLLATQQNRHFGQIDSQRRALSWNDRRVATARAFAQSLLRWSENAPGDFSRLTRALRDDRGRDEHLLNCREPLAHPPRNARDDRMREYLRQSLRIRSNEQGCSES